MAPGGYKHILVAVDKFTKWIEVLTIATIMSKEATKFVEDITHLFGVPNRIVTDLGKAFIGLDFWDFCQDNLIDVYYSSVAHPHCSGQVERANCMVLHAIKDRIFDDASQYTTSWFAELPHVIWGLRTQVSSVMGYSPFILVYGSEAVLPTGVAFGAPRIQHYEEGTTEEMCKVDLDSIEEHCVAALMRHTQYEQQLRRYHDRNIRERSVTLETWFYVASKPPRGCIVMEVVSPSTYRL
jgi:hypothetical protein